jgi:hypothetical protein
LLFENYKSEENKGNFFEELSAINLPTYFDSYEHIMQKENFYDYNDKSYNKKNNEQTIKDIIKYNEGKSNSKYARTFIMDKEFYNLNLIMSEINVNPDEDCFRYKNAYNEFE